MLYIPRKIEPYLKHHLKRGKSILLLGPRQVGKTTLLTQIKADLQISFLKPAIRQRYERRPDLLASEIIKASEKNMGKNRFLVVLDEIQKVPSLLDVIQQLIDDQVSQFILTGSSARKLRRNDNINLLPGRVIKLQLDSFSLSEIAQPILEDLLIFGSLPQVFLTKLQKDKEEELRSYVEIYLEEEIRSEALVRNLGHFSRFLELAGLEAGKITNFSSFAEDIGVSPHTIASYFEILVDCLIAERVEPITKSQSRKKLTRSNRYLFFDLGVRRVAAREGYQLGQNQLADIFEQFVGIELIRLLRYQDLPWRLQFWRDPGGPEVDWVLTSHKEYIPIEVKWKEAPSERDAKHLNIFLDEYKNANQGFIICRTPQPYRINSKITALPWQELQTIIFL